MGWEEEFRDWVQPFLSHLKRSEQRHWAPLYVQGLIGPGERKSIEPIAWRVCPGQFDRLHHFVSASTWSVEPLETELVIQADRLVGGKEAALVVDDTALVKKGEHSVGVHFQYCGQLGKQANCQSLVSLTVARGEVPVCIGLRLFLPEDWANDAERRKKAGVPEAVVFRPKWRIALEEIDRVIAQGLRFGCVLGDAEYGKAGEFRHALSDRRLPYALAILPTQRVYPADVTLIPFEQRGSGRPPKHPKPSTKSQSAKALFDALPDKDWRAISWRRGTKEELKADFAVARVRVADGPRQGNMLRLPGEEAWLVCERRAHGARRYYLSNLPLDTPLKTLAAWIKARWVCEQAHQQMKEELGLDHFEGRSWRGLHHHLILASIAFLFLQHLRIGGKKEGQSQNTSPASSTFPSSNPKTPRRRAQSLRNTLPSLQRSHPLSPQSINFPE